MTESPELNLIQTWTDETPLDQIPEEHRERVTADRAEAAAAADKAKAAAAAETRSGSRAATKARVTNPKPKAGRRPRKKPEAETEAAEDVSDRVPVVLKTSRYTGRNGRAIARKTTVMVTVDRGLRLIMQDHAREANEAETLAAAKADPIFLD
jgi:hypothetical protein